MQNSTLSGNSAPNGVGGGIGNNGMATVQNSTLSGNSAFNGGSINNSGTTTVQNSTLSGNSVSNTGGAIYTQQGTVTVQNSTLSGNSAPGGGGGISNDVNGTLTVQNSTLSGNSAPNNSGGGIKNHSGTLTLQNSIVASNSAAFLPDLSNSSGNGATLVGDYNLIKDTSGWSFDSGGGHNITGKDPKLDPAGLQDNGGPTQTIKLLPGSPAIDKGKSFGAGTDQRGQTRPNDQANATYPNAGAGDGSDIGAFESQEAFAPTLSITAPAKNVTYANAGAVPNPATGTASDASGISSVTLTLYRSALYGKVAGYWDGSTTTPAFDGTFNAATHEHLADSSNAFANWTLNLPTTLTPGQYYLKATATAADAEGNTTSVTHMFYVNDRTTSVAITAPTNGQKFTTAASRPTQATGTASDTNGIASVTGLLYRAASNGNTAGYWNGNTGAPDHSLDYSLNYDPAVHEIAATGTTNWTLALPTLRAGQYYVRATARDTAGNWKTVKHSFTVNDATPTVTITTPKNKQFFTAAPANVVGTASDSDGIEAVTVLLCRAATNGHTYGYWNGSSTTNPVFNAAYNAATHEVAANTSDDFANWTLALPTLRAGQYYVRATARDSNGNSKSVQHEFKVNDASPTVKITTPKNNVSYTTATVPTTATGTASDADGIEAVTVLLHRHAMGGNTAGYWNGASTTTPTYDAVYHPARHEIAATSSDAFANWTLALPKLGVGKYSLRATARDTLGNIKLVTHIFTVTPASSSVAKLTEPATSDSAPASTPTLRQSEASASSSSITLSFSGAVPASFDVSVNGVGVPVQSTTQDGQSVTLLLAEGTLKIGDRVGVSWKGGANTTTAQ